MPSIGRQFGKGGVPRSKEALAALELEMKGSKGDSGSKGPEDEIGLSEAEQVEARRLESGWTMEDVLIWAESFGATAAWAEQAFTIKGGRIISEKLKLSFTHTRAKMLPPNLSVNTLDAGNSQIESIPYGLIARRVLFHGTSIETIPDDIQAWTLDVSETNVHEIPVNISVDILHAVETDISVIPPGIVMKELNLAATKVRTIPPDIRVGTLELSQTDIVEVPPGLQVQNLYLEETDVKSLPEDTGLIEKVYVHSKQSELIQSCHDRGVEVVVYTPKE